MTATSSSKMVKSMRDTLYYSGQYRQQTAIEPIVTWPTKGQAAHAGL